MIKLKEILNEFIKPQRKMVSFYTPYNNHIYSIKAFSQQQASYLAKKYTTEQMKDRYSLKKPLDIPKYKWKQSKPFWEFKTNNIIEITYNKNKTKKQFPKNLINKQLEIDFENNIN